MTQVHLQFQGLELVREPSAGFGAHLLVRPLLQAIEFLGDVHCCGSVRVQRPECEGDAAQSGNECWAVSREYIDNARHTNEQEQRDEEQQPDQPPVSIEKRGGSRYAEGVKGG
jgi:hypothetical protein